MLVFPAEREAAIQGSFVDAAFALASVAVLLLPTLLALTTTTRADPLSALRPNICLRDLFHDSTTIPTQRRFTRTPAALVGGSVAQLALCLVSQAAGTGLGGWMAWAQLACWTYAGMYALLRARQTVPYAVVVFATVELARSSWRVYLALGADAVAGLPLSTNLELLSIAVDALVIGMGLSMPLVELPEGYVLAQKDRRADGKMGFSPEDECSAGRWLSFGWMTPLLQSASKGYLADDEVWELSPVNQARALHPLFSSSRGMSLLRRVFRANSFDFTIDFVLSIVTVVLEYVPALVLKEVLAALREPGPEAIRRAYLFAGLGLLAHLAKLETEVNKRWFGRRASIRANTEICAQIYDKILHRKNTGTVAGVGKIIQLATKDAPDVAQVDVSRVYNAPFQLAIGIYFLYSVLSWSAFAGVASIILLTPLQARLTRMGYSVSGAYRKAADERTSVLSECLHSIKTIKGGWDQLWLDKVGAAREKELKLSVKSSVVALLFGLSGSVSPIIVTVVSFFCYVQIQQHELTVEAAFVSLSLLSMLQGPLSNLPIFVVLVTDLLVSARRIDTFLDEDEISPRRLCDRDDDTTHASVIGFTVGARFRWNTSPPTDGKASSPENSTSVFELGPLTFSFPPRALTILAGPIGSGKSACLLALLGEMAVVDGSAVLPRDGSSVAYASQTPWLQDMSIKDNILFGSPFDQARYGAVVKACSLLPDLEMLEDGDATEIGSKGVSLSGGQKARVALARAIYSRAELVLLDDPLAAVDSQTAAALVTDCLASPLLKDRTVVIVSHHVELLLPIAHSVVQLVDGAVKAQGAVADLRASGHLGEIMAEEKKAVAYDQLEQNSSSREKMDAEPQVAKVARKMTEVEGRGIGNVNLGTYKLYLSAASWTCIAAIGALLVVTENSALAERGWIAVWTRPGSSADSPLPTAKDHPLFYLGVYIAISIAFVLAGLVRDLIGLVARQRASRKLHSELLRSVMNSTSRWLDQTPQGRILNRFTADMSKIDGPVLRLLTMTARKLATIGGSVILILTVLPPFLLPASIIGLLYLKLSVAYLRCTRDLQRIRAVTLSPILSTLESTLTGITTIRAFGAEQRFLDDFFDMIDRNAAAECFVWNVARWVMVRFDVLSALSVFLTTVLVVWSAVEPGLGGMLILASQGLLQAIYWVNRYVASLEMAMNSVERVSEYLQIPQEAPFDGPKSPPAFWPSSSCETMISVQDLVMSYDPALPPVLHEISFDVKPGEKIGIVGRTGSGKSTLGASFSRFAEFTSGRIIISGLDILTLPLRDLRSRVTHVSQEGSLWEGSVRENLDPYQTRTDDELDVVLRRVQLGSAPPSEGSTRIGTPTMGSSNDAQLLVKAHEAGEASRKIVVSLDTSISSLSQGQRQLVSLGRALVRNSSIIIMDEPTSSIDLPTDLLIQETIRSLHGTTLLTIAHRLSSVIDYDKVLVLDAGRVVEFDTPRRLLEMEEGVFRGMAERTGRGEELRRAAGVGEEE